LPRTCSAASIIQAYTIIRYISGNLEVISIKIHTTHDSFDAPSVVSIRVLLKVDSEYISTSVHKGSAATVIRIRCRVVVILGRVDTPKNKWVTFSWVTGKFVVIKGSSIHTPYNLKLIANAIIISIKDALVKTVVELDRKRTVPLYIRLRIVITGLGVHTSDYRFDTQVIAERNACIGIGKLLNSIIPRVSTRLHENALRTSQQKSALSGSSFGITSRKEVDLNRFTGVEWEIEGFFYAIIRPHLEWTKNLVALNDA
jgi:hypothetical protein